jgi:hypothetical protein
MRSCEPCVSHFQVAERRADVGMVHRSLRDRHVFAVALVGSLMAERAWSKSMCFLLTNRLFINFFLFLSRYLSAI